MNKDPMNTGHKPTTQPSLCSIISKKLILWSPEGHEEENKCSSLTSGQEKAITDDSSKKKSERKKEINKNKIITVLKKLNKIMAFLPKALQSPYAYTKGKKNCETCNMDKETYRLVMKYAKVIELIVDDITNIEQKEMLEKEDEQQDIYKPNETVGTKGEKKISIQFEVFYQKGIDHNLKCVLVKLLKTTGDMLLQLCYCKLKKNIDNEECRKYDVSVNVLQHLKFEYTNLTNSIIRLFKTPPSKQKTPPDICVARMKEEIVDCTEMLENMLKNSRNLKVSIRNDDVGNVKCCSRNYPHVHVRLQDRHVVLKFKPSQDDDKLKDRESDFRRSTPYDEWPDDFAPEPTEEGPCVALKEKSSFPKEESKESIDVLPRKEKPKDTPSLRKDSICTHYEILLRLSKTVS